MGNWRIHLQKNKLDPNLHQKHKLIQNRLKIYYLKLLEKKYKGKE